MAYETILVENRDAVALITINRPKALNALNALVFQELERALSAIDADEEIAAVVLTGSEKAFAAGADIKEMADLDFSAAYNTDYVAHWQNVTRHSKPIIAAVAGYALGGGCELAMMCDIVIAAENARFGQPEINLGTIPGAGGSQRLIREIGKSKAMEMILTGRMMNAEDAERANLVSRVVPLENLIDEALRIGNEIAQKSQPIVAMAKEAVNVAYETSLAEGLRFERRAFYATFATDDRAEGMTAFTEKRSARFSHR
ncbi:MAG: enoyl-CoA hydratase [Geminicoccaceae bacterium]|nr:enoyl-CoA hydratase [Geminicoccaceae bacterium]MCB2009223.1 enoyl-CoA hydratase [Geminicoccaceae bacterium]